MNPHPLDLCEVLERFGYTVTTPKPGEEPPTLTCRECHDATRPGEVWRHRTTCQLGQVHIRAANFGRVNLALH